MGRFWWAALVALWVPAMTSGQDLPVKADLSKPYLHKPSKLTLPASFGGIALSKLDKQGEDEREIYANYIAANGDRATLYVYPWLNGSVPLWFERARRIIDDRSGRDNVTTIIPVHGFVPNGRTKASGLVEIMQLGKVGDPKGRTSGVAMLASGGYLVKLRFTSSTLAPAALERAMVAGLQTIRLAADPREPEALRPVGPCPDTKTYSDAAEVTPTLAMAMEAALGLMPGTNPAASGQLGEFDIYCRDARTIDGGAIYRAAASQFTYLIALGDAGRAIEVSRWPGFLDPMSASPLARKGPFFVIWRASEASYGMGAFASLPTPAQALAARERDKVFFKYVPTEKGGTLSLNSALLGK